MSSHFARLKEELDAKQQELQDQQQTVESIKKITEELEAKKQALAAKAAELEGHQQDVKKMQSRLDALKDAEPAVDAAMRTKESSTDLLQHVVTQAISGDHMSGSEIFKTLLNTTVHGRGRADNLDDFLTAVVDNDEDLNDIVKHALLKRVKAGANAASLMESVAHTVYTVLGDKAATLKLTEDTPIVNLPKENAPAGARSQATPSNKNATPAVSSQATVGNENAPPEGQNQSTPGKKNGLRGQAEDFKPQIKSNRVYNSGGWEAFARENGVGNYSTNDGGKDRVSNSGGWGSNFVRGH